MCVVWAGVAGLNMAAIGSAPTTASPSSFSPRGTFIQALTVTTNQADAAPESAIGTPVHQWTRGGNRSQPYR